MEKGAHTESKRPVIYSIVPAEGYSSCQRHLIMNRLSLDLQHTTHSTDQID